jgi:hypothetical protein
MGREVRNVPADWVHPVKEGKFIPLYRLPYAQTVADWDEAAAQWEKGLKMDYKTNTFVARTADDTGTYEEWSEEKRPVAEDYMPEFPDGTATHLMMYEIHSYGTPISPALTSPEELAQWLVDNQASALMNLTASFDGWLCVAQGQSVPSMVGNDNDDILVTGVDSTLFKNIEITRAAAESLGVTVIELDRLEEVLVATNDQERRMIKDIVSIVAA